MFSTRKLASFTIVAFSAALAAVPAFAAETWTVSRTSGDVWVSGTVQRAALGAGESVVPGSVVETGPRGRAMLTRGEEYVLVAPASRISLPKTPGSGLDTTILQEAGTVLLSVEKKAEQHFEVETPHLAAVVKGTKFTVTADAGGSAVHVVEGAVEVIDLDTGGRGLVRPGDTARAEARPGAGLSLMSNGVERQAAAGTPRAAKVSNVASSPDGTAGTAAVISAPIGTTELDVNGLTGGLVQLDGVERDGRVDTAALPAPAAPEAVDNAGGVKDARDDKNRSLSQASVADDVLNNLAAADADALEKALGATSKGSKADKGGALSLDSGEKGSNSGKGSGLDKEERGSKAGLAALLEGVVSNDLDEDDLPPGLAKKLGLFDDDDKGSSGKGKGKGGGDDDDEDEFDD